MSNYYCPDCGAVASKEPCENCGGKPPFAAPTGSASLACDIKSAVVNGRKLEGDELRKFIEGMSEQDRRTMIEDMGLLEMLNKPKGPTPCSHCGGNGYEP